MDNAVFVIVTRCKDENFFYIFKGSMNCPTLNLSWVTSSFLIHNDLLLSVINQRLLFFNHMINVGESESSKKTFLKVLFCWLHCSLCIHKPLARWSKCVANVGDMWKSVATVRTLIFFDR